MNGFSNPMTKIEVRMLDALKVAVYEANPMNRALRHCAIVNVAIKRDLSSTFHHPA